MIHISRRNALLAGGALGLLGLAGCSPSAQEGERGTLVIGFSPEPPTLTSAATTAGPTQSVSTKIFDGLVTFDAAGKPQPQLALSWETAADGHSLTFKLRPNVKWHDGQPFTSADVAYSLLEVWKKLHGRGRSTFAPVSAVETPDPLTVVIRLSTPAPYLLSALGSPESQIVPRHIYAGKDFLSNPANNAPIGTGPFRFAEWRRGEFIRLERNPDYWLAGAPKLDGIIYRLAADPASAAAALETGEVHLVTNSQIALNDVKRLKALPGIQTLERPSGFTATLTVFEFNLDRPALRDPRVRQAFAHAIDKRFLLDKVWHGFGTIENSAIPQAMADFTDPSVHGYAYDPAKAIALLDAAGLKPDAQGIRLRLNHDPAPTGDMLRQSALAIRDQLRRVGIDLQIRASDFPGFLKRVYTDRDFDTIQYSASSGPDPAIGTQRFYWSPNFKPGVAFSNGSHYANRTVDRLLEQAQQESDPQVRHTLYRTFQQQVNQDLPRIPLISGAIVTLASPRVRNLPDTAYATLDNFAGVSLAPA
ncbi:ABC transporter substrate-binding protein [Sphingobium sufflavum]|uniref:ABC transporter substrate-binding protein n=1 Tax=Sphingobium sufflavum TaxID=1129547 RepID=UPI001F2555EA|nr:ABC transporter substrate-binding protein [Sphingobium sufflavum]MCE7796132.1 ABC transporter substrate-binding protein [Sphingobium sufflavum]